MDPKISIVVLVWNGEKYLDECIAALLAQDYEPFEVIVVDNASTDSSVDVIRKYVPSVRLIQNSYNFGFSGGNNIGIKAASGEIVILLNQDTSVQPGWLRAIVDAFDLDQAIGIVGCKAIYPNSSTIQHAGAWVRQGDAFAYHIGQGESDQGQYDTLKDVEYVTAAAFAVNRSVLNDVGYLDEHLYPGFYEDPDYCWRAQRAGYRTVYQPKAVLFHYETTTLPAHSYQRMAAFHRNRTRFVLKHWSISALREFVSAEKEAISFTLGLDDAIARGHGYWISLTYLSQILQQRKVDKLLGDTLTQGEVRWLFDELQSLRQQAYHRATALLQQTNSADEAADPILSPISFIDLQWLIPEESSASRFSDREQLQAQIHSIMQQHQLEEHRFRSQIPVFGRWIAKFRTFWNSIATRWYVLPLLQQQTLFNLQVCKTLETMNHLMVEMIQTLEQQEQLLRNQPIEELQTQVNVQITGIRRQLDKLPEQIEISQRMQRQLLEADDATLLEALQMLNAHNQGKEGEQNG